MKQDIYDKQLPEFNGDGTLLVWGFVRTADQEQVGKFGAGGIGKPGDQNQLGLRLLDEAAQLQDISHMPARVKCAELAWRTLDGMLEGQANQ